MIIQSITGGILCAWYPVISIIGGRGSKWWGGVWQDSETSKRGSGQDSKLKQVIKGYSCPVERESKGVVRMVK
jgi:hypothetical protein